MTSSFVDPLPPAAALSRLHELLAVQGVAPLALGQIALRRLVARIDDAPLFVHSYAFGFHLLHDAWAPEDLLTFASEHGLTGVKCHLDAGNISQLSAMSSDRRCALGTQARQLGLRWHVEISSTAAHDLTRAIKVASDLGGDSIRCYPRYEGRVSEIVARVIEDMRWFRRELDPARRFHLTLEQHEDLTSTEMAKIVKAVADPGIKLLFDFTNMTTVGERPLDALAIQAPWVSEVHLKDALLLADRGSWAQLGCRTGTGDIPVARLLADLLLLGEQAPQVSAIGLEEAVNYYSPARRFPGEPNDPIIEPREPGTTAVLPGVPLPVVRDFEHRNALDQLSWVRGLLDRMRRLAKAALDPSNGVD